MATVTPTLTSTAPHGPTAIWRTSAIEMPRKGRFRVWLRWVAHYGERLREEDHGTVYFMAFRPDGRLTIEMMDIVQLPATQTAAAAQSA